MIYVGTTKDKIRKVREIILREIKKLQNLQLRDLQEVKEQLIGLRKVGSESSEQVMINLIVEEAVKDAGQYYDYEERVNEINRKSFRRIF